METTKKLTVEGYRSHAQRFIAKGIDWSNPPSDDTMRNAVLNLYDYCGYKRPEVFIVDSTYSAKILFDKVGKDLLLSNIKENALEHIRRLLDAIDKEIENNLSCDSIETVDYNDQNNFDRAICRLWDEARVINPLCMSLGTVLDRWDSNYEVDIFSEHLTDHRLGLITISELDYIKSVVNPFAKYNEFFELYKDFTLNIFTAIMLKNICIVVRKPVALHINTGETPGVGLWSMNNVNGPAVEYMDGYSRYFINGVELTEELFNKLSSKEYTLEDLLLEPNEEIKAAALLFYQTKFGDEFVFRFLSDKLKKVSSYVDKKPIQYMDGTTKGMNIGVYTLFKGRVTSSNSNTRVAYVRCYCPSTDRMFFLGTDPKVKTAKDAIAALYRIPKVLVNDIMEIRRQGERFSTVLTPKGNRIAKKLTEEELSDMVAISGDEYFSKITYEY